jgi:shikimate kinase
LASDKIIYTKKVMTIKRNNIVLIGMPGAGKSTVGVLLAKALKKPFVDTDLLIQQKENCYLQEILDKKGIDEFIRIEEETVLGLELDSHIIATGGSVIYSENSINHLKQTGILVFLNPKPYQLDRRLKNLSTRGIALKNGQTMKDLYMERTPLYKKYADIEIDCSHKHIEVIVAEIKSRVLPLLT